MKIVEGHRKDKLKHVKLEDIIVEGRSREDLGNIDELVESVREKGIIQPITIDSEMRLMAGGRRYAAAQKLGLPTVPVIQRDFVDAVDSLEIELIENIHRKDFNWAERALLVKKIDDLQRAKHGSENWSNRKTATLLDRSHVGVSQDLRIAAALEAVPELAKYKTADDAFKMVKKMEEHALTQELRNRQNNNVEKVEKNAAAGVAVGQLDRALAAMARRGDADYIIRDVFVGLAGLPDNGKFNIIECDPPYGIDLNSQKASRQSVDSNVHTYNEVDEDAYPAFLSKLCRELYRVASRNTWMVFWFGPSWHQLVLSSLREAGWEVDEIPAIWAKKQGQTLQPELYLARAYEPFFICRKGKPVLIERGRLNVFSFDGVPGAKKYHPTQRPIELISEIFRVFGAGQQNVLIPFLGSGTSLLACYENGFHGLGFDFNDKHPETTQGYKDKFLLAVELQTRKMFDTETEE